MRPQLDADFYRRAAATAATLAIFLAGRHIPLPGLSPHIVAQLLGTGDAAVARLSVLALGVVPVLSALVLFEVLKLAAPGVARWQSADERNAAKLRGWLVGLALLLAAIQALGISVGLEDVQNLVPERGTYFRLSSVATLVAGTALVIALAAFIDRRGLGYGLWVLFLTVPLAALPTRMARLADGYAVGQFPLPALLLGGAFTVLAVAGVVALMLAWGRSPAAQGAVIWPTLIAYTVFPWALLLLGLLLGGGDLASAEWVLSPTGWVLPAALAASVLLSVLLYVRAQRQAGVQSPVSTPLLASVLVAIAASGEILAGHIPGALPLSGAQLIIATVIATSLLRDWGVLSHPQVVA